jgi:dihydrofolate reductase
MGQTVIFDMSMSLDGFVTAKDQTAEEPLGKGGERLHEWAFADDPASRELIERSFGAIGSFICGRRTYDHSIPFWDADGPSGQARLPVFVVTHEPPAASPENGVYTFVADGLERALEQAKAAAGDKTVAIMGGPDVARQYLAAGLVDEVGIHVVPVLFGGGTPMFADLGRQLELELIEAVETPAATHLRYRVA